MSSFGVATKAVIYNDKREYLILKKSDKEDINPNTYDLPGGRVAFGEELEEALVREVKEETGLNIEPMRIFNAWTFVKDGDFQLVGIDFLCKYLGGNQKLSEEHEMVEWLSFGKISKNTNLPTWLVRTIEKAEEIFKLSEHP